MILIIVFYLEGVSSCEPEGRDKDPCCVNTISIVHIAVHRLLPSFFTHPSPLPTHVPSLLPRPLCRRVAW